MPINNPPQKSLKVYLVFSGNNELGSFGPNYEDISRAGLNNLAYIETGDRGEEVLVQAIHYVSSIADAESFLQNLKDIQGNEITLESTSTGKSWMFWFARCAATYRPVVTTNSNWNYIIKMQIKGQRTS